MQTLSLPDKSEQTAPQITLLSKATTINSNHKPSNWTNTLANNFSPYLYCYNYNQRGKERALDQTPYPNENTPQNRLFTFKTELKNDPTKHAPRRRRARASQGGRELVRGKKKEPSLKRESPLKFIRCCLPRYQRSF